MPSFVAPPPSVLEQSLAEPPAADLEVVDFSEMHKFVGVEEKERRARPVASDFFGDDRPSPTVNAPPESSRVWRKMDLPSQLVVDEQQKPKTLRATLESLSLGSEAPHGHEAIAIAAPPYPNSQRNNVRHQAIHKEATMSALDDAMSRIKGALDVMQAEDSHRHPTSTADAPKLPAQKENKWLPPALRPLRSQPPSVPTEVFDITAAEPPLSPKPAWNLYNVRLPKTHTVWEPLGKKTQIQSSKVYPLKWSEVLSFDPPVEGMSRKDLSLNDVLFRRIGPKGKYKYRVSLPKLRPSAPSVQVVLPKGSSTGAFGKNTISDEQTTWRRRIASPSQEVLDAALDTTSRSPPPEVSVEPAGAGSDSGKTGSLRSRLQPKMPAGSSVAFYRDSKVIEVDADPPAAVNFIVTSELDESKKAPSSSKPSKQPLTTLSSSSAGISDSGDVGMAAISQPLMNGLKATELPSSYVHSSSKSESKSSDESVPILRSLLKTWTY